MNYGIGNVKSSVGASNTMLTTTTDATENSGTYTLALSNLSETPKINDFIAYVNNGAITTLYKVTAVDSTNATLTKIGDIGGGGGSQLYQHNINYVSADLSYYFNCSIITNSDTPFTLATLHAWLESNGFKSISGKSITASGKQASYYIWGVAWNNSTTIFLFSSANGGQPVNLTQSHTLTDTVISL